MSENPKFGPQNPNPIQDPKSEIQTALGRTKTSFWKGVSRENKDIKITTTSTTTAATNKNKKKKKKNKKKKNKNKNNTKNNAKYACENKTTTIHNYCLVPMSIAGFAKHNNIKVTLVVGRLQHSKHSKTTSLRHHGASSSWTLCTNLLYHPCLVLILGSNFQLPQTSKQFWLHLKVYLLSSPNHFRMSCATLLHDLTSKDHYKCWCQKMTDITGLRLLSNNFCQIRGFYKALAASWGPRCSIQPFCFCPSWSHSHLLVHKSTAVVLDGLI